MYILNLLSMLPTKLSGSPWGNIAFLKAIFSCFTVRGGRVNCDCETRLQGASQACLIGFRLREASKSLHTVDIFAF